MAEIIKSLSLCDYIAVLTGLCSIIAWFICKNSAKEFLRPEDKFKADAGLKYATMIEEHSDNLRMLMNRHYEKLDSDKDFQTLLAKHSKGLQDQIKTVFDFEGLLFQVRWAYDTLLYLIFIAVVFLIFALFAIAFQNSTLCWIIIGANITLIFIQFGIMLRIRKLKHYADDKTR